MIRIEILISDDDFRGHTGHPSKLLDAHMALLGFIPASKVTMSLPEGTQFMTIQERAALAAASAVEAATGGHRERFVDSMSAVATAAEETPKSIFGGAQPETTSAAPKRERGKAGEGRTRRTKTEIAEDEAADAADAARGNISTDPENRTDPEAGDEAVDPTAVDDAATTKQDEADEAAEQAARVDPGEITVDTLRAKMGEIGRKHGMPLAVKIPTYLGSQVADIPEADYPAALENLQALLELSTEDAKAMLGVGTATTTAAKTETSLEATAKKLDDKKTYDRKDLLAAMFRYAKFADGTDQVDKMKWTQVDIPVIFKEKFGVEAQADIKDADIPVAIFLIDEAIAADRFNRKAK